VASPPPEVAVSVAVCALATNATAAVNVALVAPAATVTLAGTVALTLLLDNVTLDPPLTAADDNVTVQVALPALVKLAGVQLNPLTVGTISVAVELMPDTLALFTVTACDAGAIV